VNHISCEPMPSYACFERRAPPVPNGTIAPREIHLSSRLDNPPELLYPASKAQHPPHQGFKMSISSIYQLLSSLESRRITRVNQSPIHAPKNSPIRRPHTVSTNQRQPPLTNVALLPHLLHPQPISPPRQINARPCNFSKYACRMSCITSHIPVERHTFLPP